jgi:hypothetical protein
MLSTTHRSRTLSALLFPIDDTPGNAHNTHSCIQHVHVLESDLYDNGDFRTLSTYYGLVVIGTISHPIPTPI